MLQKWSQCGFVPLQVVEDFGLVRFLPLAIEDRASVARVLEDVDKANGCAFSGLTSAAEPMPPELIYGAGVKGEQQDVINRWSAVRLS